MKNPSELCAAFVRAGKVADCPIIDTHGHFGPFQGIYFPTRTAEDMVATLDRCGVRCIISSAHSAVVDPKRGNPEMAEACRKFPDRLKAYMAINPHYPDQAKQDVETFDSRPEFVGFKFLADYYRYPITGDAFQPVYEFANARSIPILMHTWGHSQFDGPALVRKVAERYGNIPILMGHSGYGEWDAAIAVARDCPNVYLELTAAYAVNGVIEKMVEGAGSEKILFGTDLPWFDPHYAIGCICFAHITDEDRRNIFYRNAERIFS